LRFTYCMDFKVRFKRWDGATVNIPLW